MVNLLNRFKKTVRTNTTIEDYTVPDTARPSDWKMKEWRDLGFVCHDTRNGDLICYQWVNWALERSGKNVRVVKGDSPSLDLLQLLYDESIKYLQETNIE